MSLTQREIHSLRKYWKLLDKKELIAHMEQHVRHIDYLAGRIEDLENTVKKSNSNYLSGCRSVGGITLPPGM